MGRFAVRLWLTDWGARGRAGEGHHWRRRKMLGRQRGRPTRCRLLIDPRLGLPSKGQLNARRRGGLMNQIRTIAGAASLLAIGAALAGGIPLAASTEGSAADVSSAGAATPGGYVALVPARLVDTRAGQVTVDGLGPKGARAPGASVDVLVRGRGGVPAEAAAVALNVTATGQSGSGWIAAWPTGSARPSASNLNYPKAGSIANMVIAKIGTGGKVSFYNSTSSAQLIVDVLGWYAADALTGPAGPQGPAGARGEQGPAGAKGEPGVPGMPAVKLKDGTGAVIPSVVSVGGSGFTLFRDGVLWPMGWDGKPDVGLPTDYWLDSSCSTRPIGVGNPQVGFLIGNIFDPSGVAQPMKATGAPLSVSYHYRGGFGLPCTRQEGPVTGAHNPIAAADPAVSGPVTVTAP
ncbi:MAG: hypothetical protein QG597_1380 [Actinomycetota bacterium]|nr:hypothetical protein [Actinomycetota bacterium]